MPTLESIEKQKEKYLLSQTEKKVHFYHHTFTQLPSIIVWYDWQKTGEDSPKLGNVSTRSSKVGMRLRLLQTTQCQFFRIVKTEHDYSMYFTIHEVTNREEEYLMKWTSIPPTPPSGKGTKVHLHHLSAHLLRSPDVTYLGQSGRHPPVHELSVLSTGKLLPPLKRGGVV